MCIRDRTISLNNWPIGKSKSKIGINTTVPQGNYALYVQGDANIAGTLNINGNPAAVQADIVALAIALG